MFNAVSFQTRVQTPRLFQKLRVRGQRETNSVEKVNKNINIQKFFFKKNLIKKNIFVMRRSGYNSLNNSQDDETGDGVDSSNNEEEKQQPFAEASFEVKTYRKTLFLVFTLFFGGLVRRANDGRIASRVILTFINFF